MVVTNVTNTEENLKVFFFYLVKTNWVSLNYPSLFLANRDLLNKREKHPPRITAGLGKVGQIRINLDHFYF